MTLDTWLSNRWVTPHTATTHEITDLLVAAARDLSDAAKDLSPAWRFAIAYNAALRLATAALHSAGYRAAREQKHYRTLAALPLLLGHDALELAGFLDSCRARRHEITYESLAVVTNDEADELIEAALELDGRVRAWLRTTRPDLLS